VLRRRIIPCLDVANGRVVKGTRFVDLVDEGDPPELAARYADEGADEIVFLDISAAPEGRRTLLDVVERTARRAFIPLTVGGGVRTVRDMRDVLRAGADKVGLNSAAVRRPEVLTECAERYGAQSVGIAGGVSANSRLRADGAARGARIGMPVHVPHVSLSTDNAAMIAAAGLRGFHAGRRAGLALNADPSLEL